MGVKKPARGGLVTEWSKSKPVETFGHQTGKYAKAHKDRRYQEPLLPTHNPNFFNRAGKSWARRIALTTHMITLFLASATSAFVE